MVKYTVAHNQYYWWQKGVIYEIYPRSFMDTNGDGIGDLKGILSKMDYLQWLGVDAIWICPFYPSPMADFGYDITDYTGVHPMFGSLHDVDAIISEAHKRKLKVIIDFVPNHTSHEHAWFKESASSKDNNKSDWYIWHDGDAEGNPPNNWLSVFGESAWEWNETRKQYYYHAFLKEQPDLNLRNPEVQKSIVETMRFWLDRGVDGLRVDVMWHLYKDTLLRDNPPNPNYKKGDPDYDRFLPLYSTDHPEAIDFVRNMREVMDEYPERVMIGEMYLSIHQTVAYYSKNEGAHLPGNFTLLLLPWNARKIAVAIDECESSVPSGAWPNWVLGNHDRPRLATRVGDQQTKVAAMLLLTLRGTPTIYYGDEIGMRNVDIPKEEMHDPQGKKMNISRDPYRTPMQWSKEKNAGFTQSKPWLRLAPDFEKMNVADQQKAPDSLLMLYKNLLELRRAEPALSIGDYIPLQAEGDVLAYVRQHERSRILILLNFDDKAATFSTKKFRVKGKTLLATDPQQAGKEVDGEVALNGNQGVMVRLHD
jgi:alpha-glucosidase